MLAINADDPGAIKRGVAEIRAYLAAHPIPGVSAYVTGPAGIAADLDRVANEAGHTLLIATLSLVLVLLLLVYRAPLLALLPLFAVGAAYMVAIGIAYLAIKAGWIVVNTEGTFLFWCSCSAPAPTTRCCSSTATARSCGERPAAGRGAADGAARERCRRSPPPAGP